ncbi:amino acid ABC transporter permease [Geodermatophilus nigrescens]|uniref:Polar amino acid transport system permease protein/cystine transport system permease protein n=1 Tax=Geodermatophilus nigrescens TaxID=1070870 RepID=A0A1M5D0C9_9ACTN|nr:amino acid ABC transporter permease [Geodermatophilus nigrescens]SHF60473.1 polar amino acid transport system permease protein/cystine transport system permease protein [Geodermatophilus nigrescens]
MEVLEAVLLGVPVTLLVTVAALALGAVLAVPLAAARRSRVVPLRWLGRVVIDVVRGIPPVVWLFLIFFGLGRDLIRLEPIEAGIIGLGVISAGYLAEIYRGGLSAVHAGQWEAASALGMGGTDTLVRVVAPQAFRVSLPAVTTYAISLLKDSTIVSAIGVSEILFRATQSARSTGAGLTPFFVAAAVYILLSAPLAWLSRGLDARLRARVAR